jgi:hypothetical protein
MPVSQAQFATAKLDLHWSFYFGISSLVERIEIMPVDQVEDLPSLLLVSGRGNEILIDTLPPVAKFAPSWLLGCRSFAESSSRERRFTMAEL